MSILTLPLSEAATTIPGTVLAGTMDGHLRAYEATTGKVVWDYDTAKAFETRNGIKAFGGSISGNLGLMFKDGMMYINSGYGLYDHMPGNVLLAFTIDKVDES